MLDFLRKITPEWRSRIYAFVLALLPLLAAGGIIAENDIPLWAGLASALLSSTIAVANRPTVKPTVTEAPSLVLHNELENR